VRLRCVYCCPSASSYAAGLSSRWRGDIAAVPMRAPGACWVVEEAADSTAT
jgi:hypothetical protein